MEGGFREDETADFGDLLNSASSTAFGASSTYSAFGAPQDDDLATNPFADLASSSAQLPYEPEERVRSPFYSAPIASPPAQSAYDEPAYVPPPAPIFTSTEEAPASSYDPAPSPYDPAPASYEQQSSAYETSPFTAAPYEPQTFAAAPSAYDAEPSAFEPSTPIGTTNAFPDRQFVRAAAPEPETPAQPQLQPGDPDGFSYTYSRASPSTARFRSPSSPTSAAPPEAESPFAAQSTRRGKADLSALLGDEKPTTMSGFKKADRADGAAGPLGSKIAVLPAKSVGKKPVARPLAALLGLETEEEEPKKVKAAPAAKVTSGSKAAGTQVEIATAAASGAAAAQEAAADAPRAEEVGAPQVGEEQARAQPTALPAAAGPASTPTEPEEPIVPEPAPLPPVDTAVEAPLPSALETPLPPSRAVTPPQPDASSSSAPEDDKPTLSRAASAAPSALSVDSARDTPYDAMVSPLETGTTPGREGSASSSEAWPGNKQVDALDQQLASLAVDEPATPTPAPTSSDPDSASYSQYIFGEGTSTPVESEPASGPPSSEPPASRGFRAFNGSSEDGGFGATDDADSLRGTYSRSVEVGDGEDAETETGVSTPATERTVGMGEQQRSEREGSAPLPPLPAQSPTIQGSPRSTQLGGSLGPTFIITVGDPQTVGSALNPAAQHTVYTVRTRTTSSAYRKPDFAVLRRFSHFLWLYDALTQNNPGVIVPGMPEKHAIGRFGSEFVENRRLGLESALNKIVSHPMLVGDPDLRLFLESDTFHIDIKQRKIDTTAEHKGFLANLSSSISGPKFTEFDDYFDQRRQQLEAFETQLRTLLDSLAKAAKARHALQGSVAELQSAFLALAQCDLSSTLRKLLDEAATVQKKLYDLAEAQAADEEKIDGLTTVAESYARLCTSARGVFGARIKAYHTWQGAEANLRKMQTAHEKAKRSGRTHSELLNLSVAEIADDGSLRIVFGNQAERKMLDARHDFDDVSKLTKAEMARFDKEKVDDFKKALEDFADSLAARQRVVVATWQEYHDLLAAAVETNKAAAEARASTATAPSSS
ncbi:hypothetical protein JCM9279_004748 [Rhodotorula babjevae]